MLIDIYNANDVDIISNALSRDGGTKADLKIGLTSGCFDLFHSLHLVYLKRCRRLCDFLIVGVDSDDLVKKFKGPERPIVPEHQRASIISELSCVDACFIMGSEFDLEKAINKFFVNCMFKNQNFKADEIIGRDQVEIVVVPDVAQHDSTTGIIEEIKRQKSK
jgi:rfaE bifunctional protein nucleotidyltransferase chain/domain